jgi:hypothetical protein
MSPVLAVAARLSRELIAEATGASRTQNNGHGRRLPRPS